MKLFITDPGDPSVGIYQETFEIDCPFEKEMADEETLRYFKDEMGKLYSGFTEGHLYAEYDFEELERVKYENSH